MALMQSKEFLSNFLCPSFDLPSVDNQHYKLSDFDQSKALLVAFLCNHCPYVRAIESRIIALRRRYNLNDLAMVAICSNDAKKYPDDSLKALYERWLEQNYGFPYLIDADSRVAKDFDAICTPDLFLFNQKRELFYHGQLDDNWKDENQVRSHDLVQAIDALLAGKEPLKHQEPSRGCSIKWHS